MQSYIKPKTWFGHICITDSIGSLNTASVVNCRIFSGGERLDENYAPASKKIYSFLFMLGHYINILFTYKSFQLNWAARVTFSEIWMSASKIGATTRKQ